MDSIKYGKIVDFIHMLIKMSYKDMNNLIAVDATCGNGHDTLFLCDFLKENGFVFAFDVQQLAILNTQKLLELNDIKNCKLILDSHENILKYMQKDQKIDIGIFNLGYLPESDKIVKTYFESTKKAIDSMLEVLNDDGRIYIAAYLLHDNGEEANSIIEYISKLNSRNYNVIRINLLNKNNMPPEIYIIENNKK